MKKFVEIISCFGITYKDFLKSWINGNFSLLELDMGAILKYQNPKLIYILRF